ncbi:MAG: SIS domain-containing protein [Lachnospiraceae bacterium]|nr:SIS domain-containing protein [Lachnospiraceae bacterium]
MVTLYDCIKRIPSVIENILTKQDDAFASFEGYIKDQVNEIDEIVFIGSGTSNTVALTSQSFVEKYAGVRTKVVYPNDYIKGGHVYNPHALYVFTSQTGTSSVVCQVMEKLKALGYLCVSMTEADDTRLAQISPCHICLNCGPEEYGMRTIGYTASVLCQMLMALKYGLISGNITMETYQELQKQAARVPESHKVITEQAHEWVENNKRQLMRSRCIIFTGAGMLAGLAMESAVKFWEMPQVISIGYELEEGLHGPNYGYDVNHCVVVFNDGGSESDKALSLARYMKEVFHNGLVIGTKVADDKDLLLDIKGGEFQCLEFSAVPQTMAYFLTIDGGRDLLKPTDHSVMNSYFSTHSEK